MTRTSAPAVAPANAEQARAWNDNEGRHWTAHADSYETALRCYDDDLLQAAAVTPTDRVLDVGCGTGYTSRQLARLAASGSVLGVDLSTPMLAEARARAASAGLANVSFQSADAQAHPFDAAAFDLVLSRTGAMFFADARAALANLARALRPGGRLVLLTWQPPAENEWISSFLSALAAGRDLPLPPVDQPGPFSLSDPDRLRHLLSAAGFEAADVRGVRHPMYFGRTVDEGLAMVLGPFGGLLDGLDGEARQIAEAALRADLEQHHTAEGVAYASATWLTTARRRA